MPSNKPRIATYTTKENVEKFKVISAIHKMSMSEYLSYLIKDSIDKYEQNFGQIKTFTTDNQENI